ncbi:MAG: OmpH family outer membrane protein [Candidatus Acetothermia bacterium]|jgi:Skp family chaperone for outer membrane proteins|nr:OmpH family outer membrane protein [Candidatus Acetothermia bacterium]MDH7506102.1 OmpH family outer membrane protein [Candidatus Acetothermia bacterium]
MKQALWIVLIVVALVAGFFGGWLSKGSAAAPDANLAEQVKQLQQQVSGLAKSSDLTALQKQVESLAQKVQASTTGGMRIAYVNAEEVFLKYKGTATAVQQFSAEREKKEKELQQLAEQLQAKKITQQEYQRRVEEIQNELQQLDLQLTGKVQQEMIAVITEVAQERGYDWVTRKKDVVLYSKAGLMDDLTAIVIDRLNARVEGGAPAGS